MTTALKFGIVTVVTDSSIPTVELAQWAEDRGFESLFMGEHSHIPTSRRTPYPGSEALPEYYKHFPDPFVELTAAAAVTQALKVGTAVCLLTEHHPITLAKTVATLDRVSAGRFLLGIGGRVERGGDGQSRRRVQEPLETDARVRARPASDLERRGSGVPWAVRRLRRHLVLAQTRPGGRASRVAGRWRDAGNAQARGGVLQWLDAAGWHT